MGSNSCNRHTATALSILRLGIRSLRWVTAFTLKKHTQVSIRLIAATHTSRFQDASVAHALILLGRLHELMHFVQHVGATLPFLDNQPTGKSILLALLGLRNDQLEIPSRVRVVAVG